MIKNKNAFAPFALGESLSHNGIPVGHGLMAIGRHYCVGKNLAYSELRIVTALLASKYDISFAPGEEGMRVVNDTTDQFTASPGPLQLVFRQRKPE